MALTRSLVPLDAVGGGPDRTVRIGSRPRGRPPANIAHHGLTADIR